MRKCMGTFLFLIFTATFAYSQTSPDRLVLEARYQNGNDVTVLNFFDGNVKSFTAEKNGFIVPISLTYVDLELIIAASVDTAYGPFTYGAVSHTNCDWEQAQKNDKTLRIYDLSGIGHPAGANNPCGTVTLLELDGKIREKLFELLAQ